MERSLSEILNQVGENRSAYFNALTPPVVQSSTFAFPTLSDFREAIAEEHKNHVYTRGNNPTVEILRKKMAALEKTDDALIVSSGSAAIALAVLSNVRAGDHIISIRNPYSWTQSLFARYLPRFGVRCTFVDGSDLEAVRDAISPETRLLYLESPNTLTYEIQDLSAAATIAREHDLISIVDNSYATPVFQAPADFGIDIIVHSVTKYLNGHSDVVAGAICGTQETIEQIFYEGLMPLGPAISPSDAALVLRGLRTLDLRMQRIYETTLRVIHFLREQPRVKQCIYPLDPSFPQYALAERQMSGCGGLITAWIDAENIGEMYQFVDRLTRFQIAVSWGGTESLVLPVAALYDLPGREDPQVPWNVVRFSLGLEDAEYLIDDLSKAFAAMGNDIHGQD